MMSSWIGSFAPERPSKRGRSPLPVTACVLLASATLALAISGCQSGPRLRYRHEYKMNVGDEHHSGLVTALVLPIDALNEAPVRGIGFKNDRIWDLLVEHLAAHGIEAWKVDSDWLRDLVREVDLTARLKARTNTSGTLSNEIGLAQTIPELIDRIGKEPDLVIAPELVVRDAVHQGKRQIVWDGVKRRDTVELRGNYRSPSVSMHVEVLARDGKELFSGFGGIEQLFRVDLSARGKMVQREDLYEHEDNIREGICVALYPWFGLEETCRR